MLVSIRVPRRRFIYYKELLQSIGGEQLIALSEINLEDIASFLLDRGWIPNNIKDKCRSSVFYKEYRGTIVVTLESGIILPSYDINRGKIGCAAGFVHFAKKKYCKVTNGINYLDDCNDDDDEEDEIIEDKIIEVENNALQIVRIIAEVADNSLPGMSFEEALDKITVFKNENIIHYGKK